jgi:deazaflavin-dependent oxidoreductase (nitroreductase family)
MARTGSIEARLFGTLNRVVEPAIRRGLGSSACAPSTFVVVETIGRSTGRRRRVPVASIRVKGLVVVGTFRGRSQWIRNLAAKPDVRYWIGGRETAARAHVLRPGRMSAAESVPPAARKLLPILKPYRRAGWSFAILAPRPKLRNQPRAA